MSTASLVAADSVASTFILPEIRTTQYSLSRSDHAVLKSVQSDRPEQRSEKSNVICYTILFPSTASETIGEDTGVVHRPFGGCCSWLALACFEFPAASAMIGTAFSPREVGAMARVLSTSQWRLQGALDAYHK
jgi:hypothetical protein